MLIRALSSTKNGVAMMVVTFVVVSMIVLNGAPTFLSFVLIPKSLVITAAAYSVLGFILGFTLRWASK